MTATRDTRRAGTDVTRIVENLLPLATPIGQLRLLEGNPRVGDVDAVAASLARFGQRKPVVAKADGTVIAGNHTLQAARRLGWSHIAVVRVVNPPYSKPGPWVARFLDHGNGVALLPFSNAQWWRSLWAADVAIAVHEPAAVIFVGGAIPTSTFFLACGPQAEAALPAVGHVRRLVAT